MTGRSSGDRWGSLKPRGTDYDRRLVALVAVPSDERGADHDGGYPIPSRWALTLGGDVVVHGPTPSTILDSAQSRAGAHHAEQVNSNSRRNLGMGLNWNISAKLTERHFQ